MRLAIALAVAAGLGAIAATIVVGSRVREDTVVARPYEEGLQHDTEREATAALGWSIAIVSAPQWRTPLEFEVKDRSGAPVAGAAIRVAATRTGVGRGQREADARETGGGRYLADLAFPAAGTWDVRFDVRRDADRARLDLTVRVESLCELTGRPCSLDLGDGTTLTLDLSPRPPRAMADLAVVATVERAGAPVDGARVEVGFEMPGMEMGPNRRVLEAAGGGRYRGGAVLVRCASGRRDWIARVTVAPPGGAPRTAAARLEVVE